MPLCKILVLTRPPRALIGHSVQDYLGIYNYNIFIYTLGENKNRSHLFKKKIGTPLINHVKGLKKFHIVRYNSGYNGSMEFISNEVLGKCFKMCALVLKWLIFRGVKYQPPPTPSSKCW